METLASTPANADNTGQVESTAADANVDKTIADGSAPSVPEADTPEKKRDAFQERIDKLTREKYDFARSADQKDYQLERTTFELEQLKKQLASQSETQTVAPSGFPTLEQYGYDEGKFQAAVAAHYSKLATEQARTATQEQLRASQQAEADERANRSWATKEAEFLKSKPDYVEKVRDARFLPISREVQQELKSSEFGPQVAYYLVENPEKAAAIMQLPLAAQLREVGKIEARLEAQKSPPKPAVSQAPPPVKKVESESAEVEPDPANMTDHQFAKWRRKQIAARR